LFSRGVGAGWSQATAGVVVGGQTLSLLLTLYATPVAYSLFDGLREGAASLLRRAPTHEPEPGGFVTTVENSSI
jgi:hypothetical protein